jgi:hypothetical protein
MLLSSFLGGIKRDPVIVMLAEDLLRLQSAEVDITISSRRMDLNEDRVHTLPIDVSLAS